MSMLKEIIIAIQSFFVAHRFIAKHRLWKWILIPGICYVLLFALGIWFFWITSNHVTQLILTQTGIRPWLDTMKTGWLNFFVIVGQIIIWMVILMFYFSLFKYLFLIIGSPVFAWLSEKTDSILHEKDFPFSAKQLVKDMGRSIQINLRNLLWQSVYFLTIFILAFIPLIGWIAPLIGLMVEFFYFGFAMLDYNFERNKISPKQSIFIINRHKGLAIGNGLVFYAMHLIPLLGWVLAPSYAVVAATLSIETAKKKNIII